MNELETALLTRQVRATCPAQRIDEYTPDAWHQIFQRLPFELSLADARDAVETLGADQPFIAPADIVRHVRRLRAARIDRLPQPCPNTTEGVAERDELLAIRTAIADGLITTTGQLAAYEAWGGSLHLARQAGRMPALDGPAPAGTGPILAGRERTGGHPVALGALARRVAHAPHPTPALERH